MSFRSQCAWALFAIVVGPIPASAQTVAFERTLPVGKVVVLDVSTIRGKIRVAASELDHVVVRGTATVRSGADVPANAEAIAHAVAQTPRIEQRDDTVRLSPPTDRETQRAVTVAYDVLVPPQTTVRALSDSGAVSVEHVAGAVSVRTTSGAIALMQLEGDATITSGSGAVSVDGLRGSLHVVTQSSGITLRNLGGDLQAQTDSGRVAGTFDGHGDVTVETRSSAVSLVGVQGGLTVSTLSGRVSVAGSPARPWRLTTGSGSIGIGLDGNTAATVSLSTRSGSISVDNDVDMVRQSDDKRELQGTIGGGGTLVQGTSRSGSIRLSLPEEH